MSERHSKLLIDDILDSAQAIQTFVKGISYDEFLSDRKTRDAVIRNFEIIGEAARQLPEEFKEHHSSIE